MPFIEAVHLTKRYKAQTALEDISFDVNKSEIVAVMGANGAGKSTLLRVLAGLVTPTSGNAFIGGINASTAPAAFRRCVGYASGERSGFYERLTGWQNLEFFSALYRLYGAVAKQRINEVFEMTAMSAPTRPYQELSTGMKQRLLLARALLHDPQVLLLDEPARSLDPVEVERFYLLVKQLQAKGKTVIFTTHQRQDAEAISNRLILLDRGCIQSEIAEPQMSEV